MPYLDQLFELFFNLLEFVFPYWHIFEPTWEMEGNNRTLSRDVMLRVEKDNV